VASLARPGGNVTGLSFSVGVETLLRSSRTGQSGPRGGDERREGRGPIVGSAASQLLEARDPNEFDGAFAAMAKERVAALLVVADSLFLLHRARLADLAAKNQLPSMHGVRGNVESGGLMSYGPSLVATNRRAAFFVDKILKGAQPADLPIEQPTKFELVINLKTAKALGLTIPTSLLLRADHVIE
jgi:putative ABC transport system substrate-binding protein